jgi:hypothetical protein
MKVVFTHCQLKGCKNITQNNFKEDYGAYCFLHSKYTHQFGYEEFEEKSPSKFSSISPRRTPLSPTRIATTYDTFEETLDSVSSSRYKVPSPSRKAIVIPKIECGICKDFYEQTNVMKCGHLICKECLQELRSPYCPFCGEYMEGPFITEEIMQMIQDKYKQDLNQKGEKYEEGDADF